MSDHGDAPDRRTDIADLCRVTGDGVGPHADLLEEFPYLGVPHAVQV